MPSCQLAPLRKTTQKRVRLHLLFAPNTLFEKEGIGMLLMICSFLQLRKCVFYYGEAGAAHKQSSLLTTHNVQHHHPALCRIWPQEKAKESNGLEHQGAQNQT